jgi:hypothetical protein
MQLDEPPAAIAMDKNALEIIDWLASDECHKLDGAGLIGSLGAKLSEAERSGDAAPLNGIPFAGAASDSHGALIGLGPWGTRRRS